MGEETPPSPATIAAEPDDFGPHMILLGAAGLLARIGQADRGAYADRFIAHVLDRHFDPASGLLRNVPGEDACNVGHAIEFVGFALDHLPADADAGLVATLETILLASVRHGLKGPGIVLAVSAATGRPLSPYCPWWSLPETMRSAALAFERTGSGAALDVWKAAHRAFFVAYWRGAPPIAYQCRTTDGPVDYVPATPDLDPGYHTGLSLLAAIGVADRMTG
jgi:mannose/cellobiose epimerase-like protein (N-acyl-D-glucosamine 2-epimerase family)